LFKLVGRICLAWHAPALIPAAAPVLLGVVAEVERRLHQRDVAERSTGDVPPATATDCVSPTMA
jgi:hypothetical protein